MLFRSKNVIDNETGIFWNEAPEAGYYYLYAEAKGWSGNFKKTEQIKIYIGE